MRKTVKVGFALAMAALAVSITILAVTSAPLSTNAATPAARSGQAAQISTGQPRGDFAVSDGCQDSAALVTGYDPITGLACTYR